MMAMSEAQKRKILDVMHTLSCIREGIAVDPKKSAEACWKVLDEVLAMDHKK